MGSLTIFGTVELQFLLRTFDILQVSLILLQALSSVRSQASLQLLRTQKQPTSTTQDISHLNPESASILSKGGNTVSSMGFTPVLSTYGPCSLLQLAKLPRYILGPT